MNLSKEEVVTGEKKLYMTKLTTLNPNAAEFVPSSLKSASGSRNSAETSFGFSTAASITSGKGVLDRSESSVSNNTDEEARRYWCQQLPDDITPDFKVMENVDSLGVKNFSLSSLSLTDVNESPSSSALSGADYTRNDQIPLSPNLIDGNLHLFSSKHWDRQIVNHDQLLSNVRGGAPYAEQPRHGFLTDMINGQEHLENADINPVEFLTSQFPDFAAESLAEVYFANGGDLSLTIKMLTQLEIQVDNDLSQNVHTKAFSAPRLSGMDFPALSTSVGQCTGPKFSGDKMQQIFAPCGSSVKDNLLLLKTGPSVFSRGATDFASAVQKMAPQTSAMRKYNGNASTDSNVGPTRNSHLLASSNNSGQVKGIYGDRLQSRGSGWAAPVWLETGEAVANMYPEMREEARDHAVIHNAYFEQAREAYLVGNKALAKELSAKGQLHNMQMKAAHEKAQDSIYRHRHAEIQGNGRLHERTIDLHGLHVSEALLVLKRELAVLRNAARSVDQHLQVYICVGTGHHTRGTRTPARLPLAVQRYLLEEEGLDYSEPQPGLLWVVIY